MATMAYPAYDNFSRQSRRQSLAYGAPPVGYPYGDQRQGLYDDPVVPGMPGLVDNYPQPSYPIYAPPTAPLSHRLTGPSFEDLTRRDSYFPDDRQMTATPFSAVVPHSSLSLPRRHRRHSVSFSNPPPAMDPFRRPSSIHVKFKRKGSFSTGITLGEAQSRVRLSSNDSYSIPDFHADHGGRILLKIRWTGHTPLTYEVPVDNYDGRVSLQTLARRISRACVHYLQANVIPIPWDRVELHYLEEVAYGTWQPMLSTR
jgi:hypothetical protein